VEDHVPGEVTVTSCRRLRFLVRLAALAAASACAEPPPPPPPPEIQPIAVIELDSNLTVEVIGLRRWTVEMLRDSLSRHAPDEGLDDDATAANLRNLLGFADAATTINAIVFDENEKTTITLAVREPQDSARVHYAPQSLDSLPRVAEWKPMIAALWADSTGRLVQAVAAAHLEGPSRVVVDSTVRGRRITHREGYAFESPADSLAARPILDGIAGRTSERDLVLAIETIERSTSRPDRALAVLILANFAAREEAWGALLKAAVGREQGRDASIAQQALVAMSERFARPVDWTAHTTTIHQVLDGTALAALAPLALALSKTGASPAQAAGFLAGGGEMLTAYLESDNPTVRDPAHALLVALRGVDLGPEPGPWRAWIGTLKS
jgi:hypothetical protein